MLIRDRIRELRRVPANQLRPNPKNWRTHPTEQLDALKGVLAEVGFAGASLARELDDGSLMLIDGHARAEVSGDAMVPVLILDVTESEADKILATFDTLGGLATTDVERLDALLQSVSTESAAVEAMLDDLAKENGLADQVAEIDAPELADGDRQPFQQMTFTLHDDQAETIKAACEAAKKAGPFVGPNENSNGNALARIAEAYLGRG